MKQIGASKNRFFSIIGHDIREPLNAIEGLMDLIARKEFKDLETKAMVKKMSKAARNTKLLINNLLEWSLTQSENVVFTKKRVQIDMLISDALVDVETQAEAKKISIKLENNDPIIYNGDPMMIRTIVRNILSNAIKFTQKFGKVNVNTFHSIDGLVIEISDNGAGMTDKEQEDLFELSNERTRKDADGLGTSGLGLVLAMDFARKHGGTIKVKSSVGEGSRFRLILPEDRPGFI
ncbi:MAG: HAMP domain-containing histidine kinase [Flavobacteriales bacterium]|nr:HAMP domain-containing histidine kinase [Flavobacteriales bacterium]